MPKHAHTPSAPRDIALAILTYLELHPRARDTAEGIAHWWVRADVSVVKEALDILVDGGAVTKCGERYSRHHRS